MMFALRQTLQSMVDEDRTVRFELVESGRLFDGYAEAMERVHKANARKLERIIDEHGWPDRELAGEEGSKAAWLVLQHAISSPALQRRCLPLLQTLAAEGRINPQHPAYLEDRICCFEGRPQRYGTQFDWDDDGLLGPGDIDDPDGVDERRARIGLGTLAEATAAIQRQAEKEENTAPPDIAAYRREADAWARSVGWR